MTSATSSILNDVLDQLKDQPAQVLEAVRSYFSEAAESLDLMLDLAAQGDTEAKNVFRDVEQGATIRLQNTLEFLADTDRRKVIQIAMSTLRGGIAVLA